MADMSGGCMHLSIVTSLRAEAMKTRTIVLVLLVMQTTAAMLLMRYFRTAVRPPGSGPPYLATVAVFMAEAFKLPFCIAMTAWSCGGPTKVWGVLRTEICEMWTDALKCAVPAVAYTLQSNLLFVALANLDAPTYQITYQTKTIFTALFSRLLLGRRLEISQWMALLLLKLGCVLVTDLRGSKPHANATGSRLVGLSAVGAAALLSSSSSVYFEKMLKKRGGGTAQHQAGLWLRNIQLGMFALPLAAAGMAYQDYEQLRDYGMLQGFDGVVYVIANTLEPGRRKLYDYDDYEDYSQSSNSQEEDAAYASAPSAFQIQYYGIFAGSAVGLVVISYTAIHMMWNMPLIPDSLLFGGYTSLMAGGNPKKK